VKNTKIEWAHHTFNPWIGCTKVSPACDNCYAEKSMPAKMLGVQWGAHAERRLTSESNRKQPLRWNAEAEKLGVRYRVFCASLADVFDNAVPDSWRIDLLDLIHRTPHLDWLLLTKRIGNAHSMLNRAACNLVGGAPTWWSPEAWPNVWLGATICNQEEADRDIPKLLAVPAAKRFLSMEPLLGPVDLTWIDDGTAHRDVPREEWGVADDDDSPPGLWWNVLTGDRTIMHGGATGEWSRRDASIDWAIIGGESGPNARPMHPEWVRSLRDQCQKANVPFLFKQWGEFVPALSGMWYYPLVGMPQFTPRASGKDAHDFGGGLGAVHIGKKHAGRLLDGREWNEVPT